MVALILEVFVFFAYVVLPTLLVLAIIHMARKRREAARLEANGPWRWEVRSRGFAGALVVYCEGFGWSEVDAAEQAKEAAWWLDESEKVMPELAIVWRVFPRDSSWEQEEQGKILDRVGLIC